MISFNEVSKNFKNDFWGKTFCALDEISFQIGKERLVGFLGANGAGKTTLMKILMGFIRADQGTITFDKNIMGGSFKDFVSNVGYLPERPYFYPHLSGKEFLEYMGKLNNVSKSRSKKIIDRWSERLAIDFALNRKIQGYSKGMLQRLGFISTLLHDPPLFVLDEPLSGLDPLGRKELKDAIVELHKKGKTIFFSSHIVSDVEEICSHIVVLEKGRLFYEGSASELIANNTMQQYQINYATNLDEVKKMDLVAARDRDQRITEIINGGGEVHFVGLCKPTLEEIIYRIERK